jgi:sulfite reductase alpha subunit-like flavoprotein
MGLSAFCEDPAEMSAMQWLCVKGPVGNSLWSSFIESQALGIGEIFELFPSCCPSLSGLMSCTSPMPPRAYSVCSSQLKHPHSAKIALSIVKYCCGVGYSKDSTALDVEHCIKRRGLCTSYIEKTLINANYLLPHDAERKQNISPIQSVEFRIIHRPSVSFHLPSCISHPVIMIGPGTGVAPFIGFLEHRAAQELQRRRDAEDTSTGVWRGGFELDGSSDLACEGNHIDSYLTSVHPAGPMWLFFGCRNENDWIFKVAYYYYIMYLCIF